MDERVSEAMQKALDVGLFQPDELDIERRALFVEFWEQVEDDAERRAMAMVIPLAIALAALILSIIALVIRLAR